MTMPVMPVPTSVDASRQRLVELLGERHELAAHLVQLEMEIDVLKTHLVAAASRRELQTGGKMAYRISAAAKLLDVSEDVLRREIAAGRLKSYLIGGARVVLAEELREYLGRLPERREE